jgi:hypothetical protein
MITASGNAGPYYLGLDGDWTCCARLQAPQSATVVLSNRVGGAPAAISPLGCSPSLSKAEGGFRDAFFSPGVTAVTARTRAYDVSDLMHRKVEDRNFGYEI